MVGGVRERSNEQPEVSFDRRVPQVLVEALAPGAPFHDLVPAPDSPHPLDLQLRALRPAGSPEHGYPGHATLYLGHARVIDLHVDAAGRFWLRGQKGKGEFAQVHEDSWNPSWSNPQALETLDATSRGHRGRFVANIIEAAGDSHTGKEGRLQARLTSWPEDFVVIDREAVPSFASQELRDRYLQEALMPIRQAISTLRKTGERWTRTREVPDPAGLVEAVSGKSFGPELDCLAIDQQGRLLIIEAKHASDTGGVGWTPCQVAVYLRLFRTWVERARDAATTLTGMLAQRRQLGLAPGHLPDLGNPPELVPVIAIGGDLGTSAREANDRMQRIVTELAHSGEPLAGLEVWQIYESDLNTSVRLERRALGALT
jgi:hypothetical protein